VNFVKDLTLAILIAHEFELQKQYGDKYVTLIVGCALNSRSLKFDTMSVTEVKLKTLEMIMAINDEAILAEIYDHLKKIEAQVPAEGGKDAIKLSKHFDDIASRYDSVLQKLAQ
jgi:biotin-(acetyl-CoA carboxylase) ligase